MKILFVSSELTPLAKVGGLGDAVYALTKALRELNLDVSVIIPLYEFIDKSILEIVKENIEISIGDKKEKISVFRGKIPNSDIPVFFISNQKYLSLGPAPYFEQTDFSGAQKEIQRFVFFSLAVNKIIQEKYIGGFAVQGIEIDAGLAYA